MLSVFFPNIYSFILFLAGIVFLWFILGEKDTESLLLFSFTVILSFIIVITGDVYAALSADLIVALLDNFYKKKFYYIFPLLVIDFLIVIFFFQLYLSDILLSISVSSIIAVAFSSNLKSGVLQNEKAKGKDSKIERNRDFFQLATGIVLLLILFFFPVNVSFSLILVILLLLLLLGNTASIGTWTSASRFLYKMEREHTTLGIGSIMIAAGTLFAVALISNRQWLLITVFIVLIGDSVSSLVGMRFPVRKLPYSRRKSFGGFISMLVVTLIFAIIVTGGFFLYPLLFPVIGTVVESITARPLDDNLTVPFSLVLLNLILV